MFVNVPRLSYVKTPNPRVLLINPSYVLATDFIPIFEPPCFINHLNLLLVRLDNVIIETWSRCLKCWYDADSKILPMYLVIQNIMRTFKHSIILGIRKILLHEYFVKDRWYWLLNVWPLWCGKMFLKVLLRVLVLTRWDIFSIFIKYRNSFGDSFSPN